MIKASHLIKILFVFIYILPITYIYFPILPNKIKWITDLLLIITFFLFFEKNLQIIIKQKIFKLLLLLTLSLILITVISSVWNKCNFIYTLLDTKRLIYPLLIYVFLTSLILEHKFFNIKINKLYNLFLKIQLVVIPIQYISYYFIPEYKNWIGGTTHLVDCAAGTIGKGTGTISVLIVILFLYQYVILKKKNSFVYLTPLLFTFSNGANILLLVSLIILFITGNIKTWSFKGIFSLIFLIAAGFVFSYYVYEKNILVDSFSILDTQVERNFSEKWQKQRKIEGVQLSGKLSRTDGYLYLNKKFKNKQNYVWGLGSDVISSSTTFGIKSNKLPEINEITSQINLLIAKGGYLTLFIFYFYWMLIFIYLLKRRKRNVWFKGGALITLIFVLSIFYTTSFNSIPIMFFVMYILSNVTVINIIKNKSYGNYNYPDI